MQGLVSTWMGDRLCCGHVTSHSDQLSSQPGHLSVGRYNEYQ